MPLLGRPADEELELVGQVLRDASDVVAALHLAVIRLIDSSPAHHRRVFEGLRAEGIGVQLHYSPVHLQPYYRRLGFQEDQFPEAEGYASRANRAAARARGVAPVIPHKSNEKDKPKFFARTLYKARARIEQGIGRIKRFKRVALRCEKTAQNYRSIVSSAAGLCLIKFVHTA